MPRKRKPPQQGPGYSDSQAPKVPAGLQYGEGAKLERAQRAMPLPTAPTVAAGAQTGPPQQAPGPLEYAAATTPPPAPITSPTDRPGEPLTTGMTSGPGPGPEVLGQSPGLSSDEQIRALYLAEPTAELGELIAFMRDHP